MEYKLYVGNLSYSVTEDDLRSLFAGAGTVVSVSVVKDRYTGSSKGFAFVEMGSAAEMEEAIKKFNNYALDNRNLKVDKARPPEQRPSSGGGYGSGRGGSGGGGGGGYRDQDRNRRSGGGYRR